MYIAIWILMTGLWAQPTEQPRLEFGSKTVLVYQSEAGDQKHQFVIRIARFKPDLVFEWESLAHQGTVHLFRKAVSSTDKISMDGLFEPGIDTESKDVMTKWLSEKVFQTLVDDQRVKVSMNRLPLELSLESEGVRKISLNENEVTVSVLQLRDSRDGMWIVNNDRENPVVLGYETPHYKEGLVRVITESTYQLRWLRQIPPVK